MENVNAQKWFEQRLTTPALAMKAIPAGCRILIGSGAAEPVSLVNAMVDHGDHFADNEVVHILTLGPAPYVRPEFQGKFRHTAFFIGPNVREAIKEGRADFMPVFLSEIPELIRSRRVRVDVALIQVSPPDARGYVSLGVSVDVVRSAVEAAAMIIAEVNPHVPRTHGDSFIDVRRIHHFVRSEAPLLERRPEPLDEVTRQIGHHIAQLVPNGATLQLGIGKIPDAVLAALGHHQDLGIHTEMMSDGVMDLTERGVITGRKKTLLPQKLVTSFIMGTRKLYEWCNDHPAIEMRPSEFTNDPFTIARNDQMIAVNSALAVDLTGQVSADTINGCFFSGIGGQVDFIRGAARSKGGKPIIALPSTAKQGTLSRIQACLESGAGVVTSRGDVRYVVTEYGVAELWGKSIRERALALISIAHPDFRGELMAAAKGRTYVYVDQRVPSANYPWSQETREKLETGELLLLRPARLTDERALQELLYRLSDESVYKRFLAHKRAHPREEVLELVNLDYDQNMAIVAVDAAGELVGSARYDLNPATRLADIAFVVRDDWQNKGVGTLLMRRMKEIAQSRGLAGFELDVLSSNKGMLGIVQKSGMAVTSRLDANIYHLVTRFGGDGQPPAEA
ncbi:MAG: GNAT family N-acetyltransferase [Myxococcota bacterium]|nr:GNAT family N-acetyltransferase [Myxococcota bacterium]